MQHAITPSSAADPQRYPSKIHTTLSSYIIHTTEQHSDVMTSDKTLSEPIPDRSRPTNDTQSETPAGTAPPSDNVAESGTVATSDDVSHIYINQKCLDNAYQHNGNIYEGKVTLITGSTMLMTTQEIVLPMSKHKAKGRTIAGKLQVGMPRRSMGMCTVGRESRKVRKMQRRAPMRRRLEL